jgi:hypothetical protein
VWTCRSNADELPTSRGKTFFHFAEAECRERAKIGQDYLLNDLSTGGKA